MVNSTHSIADWQAFIELIRCSKDDKQLTELLDFFFTLDEKSSLKMRIHLINELILGDKTQRDIAKDLQISIAKITRGSNQLKQASLELRELLQLNAKN